MHIHTPTPILAQALERTTGAGLPPWAQDVLRDGRRCAAAFAAELRGAARDGPARRVADFEGRRLLPPADDVAAVMGPGPSLHSPSPPPPGGVVRETVCMGASAGGFPTKCKGRTRVPCVVWCGVCI